MSLLISFLLFAALVVWVVGADITVNAIERDPLLMVIWNQHSRVARIALILLAWPLVSGVAVLILFQARDHG